MPPTHTVEVKLADMPAMRNFIDAVARLIRAIAPVADTLPESVIEAADDLRAAMIALGGRDIGPAPR